MTPRPVPAPARPRMVDPAWLVLDFSRREGTVVRPKPPPPSGLREAIVRWLEQEF